MKYLVICLIIGCSGSSRPAAYSTELEECSRTSVSFEESVSCENKVRVKYNRPLRVVDGGN